MDGFGGGRKRVVRGGFFLFSSSTFVIQYRI